MKVTDIGPVLGSQVEGVDLAEVLDEATLTELRRLFDERGVLLFRGVAVAGSRSGETLAVTTPA